MKCTLGEPWSCKTDKLESVARKSGVDYDIGRLPYAVWFRFYTLLPGMGPENNMAAKTFTTIQATIATLLL